VAASGRPGLTRCHQRDRPVVHRRGRDPVLDFRRGHSHRVLNLRRFRGVNKVYLYQYVAMFESGYNAKRVTVAFVQALSGVPSATIYPT
jgi:hypothetical protein